MRQLYLGRGPRDEVHQGFSGNSLLVGQPTAANVLRTLVVLFCKSTEDVSRAHALVVQRDKYTACMEHRIAVCPTFANVQLDRQACDSELPANAVPQSFVDHATAMPEMINLRTSMDGPATRHSQFGPNPEDGEESEDQ